MCDWAELHNLYCFKKKKSNLNFHNLFCHKLLDAWPISNQIILTKAVAALMLYWQNAVQ